MGTLLGYSFVLVLICYLLFEYVLIMNRKIKELFKDYEKLQEMKKELLNITKKGKK